MRLHDIDDINAFVVMCIRRSRIKPQQWEWEDTVAEGIAILWAMSTKYDQGIGCFSGYAVKYLPRKIKEAYLNGNEHCVRKRLENGSRSWEYYERPQSYDVATTETRDHSENIDERTMRHPGNFITPSIRLRSPNKDVC
jgi:hypothetical protein